MRSAGSTVRGLSSDRIAQLESLVDELVKDRPEEERIRHCVKAAGLKYDSNHVALMEQVLIALEGARMSRKSGKSGKSSKPVMPEIL
jgi:hypothetical protein